MADLTIAFKKERDTKNKVRFAELPWKDGEPKIGTLYVTKEALKELGDPEEITIMLIPSADYEQTIDALRNENLG